MRTTRRVFAAFAVKDRHFRDLLEGPSLYTKSPFEYTDMSVKEPGVKIALAAAHFHGFGVARPGP